jgi:ribonuclease BN (tRNA processing enzyme)
MTVSHLIIETAFSDEESELARLSQHLCPKELGRELAHLTGAANVHITHIKPGEVNAVMAEVSALATPHRVSALRAGQVLELA